MSRIRTVKPALFRHEELFEAERATGLPLRLAFIALWTACDREGRFRWRPRALKLDCMPYDDVDFSLVLDGLWKHNFIEKYEIDGEIYGLVPTFEKHQIINQREPASACPAPSKECAKLVQDTAKDCTGTVPVQYRDSTRTGAELREGEGEGEREREGIQSTTLRFVDCPPAENPPVEKPVKPKRAKAKTAIDPDAQPTAADLDHAQTAGVDLRIEWPRFRDYHLANPKGSADWPASWRTWCGNVRSWPRAGSGRNGPSSNTMVNAFQKIGRRDEHSHDNGANGHAGGDKPKTRPPAFDLVQQT